MEAFQLTAFAKSPSLPAHQDLLDPLAHQEMMDPQDNLVTRVNREHLENKEHPARLKIPLASNAQLAHLDRQDHQVPLEIQEMMANQASPELEAAKDNLDLQDPLGLLDSQETQDHRASQDNLDKMDSALLQNQDQRDHQDLQETQVDLDSQVAQETPEAKAHPDQLELQANQDSLEEMVTLVNQEAMANLEPMQLIVHAHLVLVVTFSETKPLLLGKGI